MEAITAVLAAIWNAISQSTEAIAVITAFILSIVPGPFKWIVRSVINWFIDNHLKKTEEVKEHQLEVAVLAAEDYKKNLIKAEVSEEEAGRRALDEAIRNAKEYGLFDNDKNAETAIRAKYQELKGLEILKP